MAKLPLMSPYSELRSAERISLSDAVPLDLPLTVYVEPTNLCNLSCDFCPQSLSDYKQRAGYFQHMEIALYRRIVEELSTMGIKSLKLYFFGEPLMHPQIGEICRLASRVCDRVELTTNAIPMTESKARDIISGDVDYLRVSWYGVRTDKVLDNLARLWQLRNEMRSSKPFISVKVFDRAEAEKIKSLCAAVCDEITVERLHTIGSDFVQLASYSGQRQACPFPFYNLVVKANGDVVPCCVAWEQSLIVGNVNTESLESIWRGEKLANIHRLHLAGRRKELAACAHCDTIFNCPDSVDSITPKEYESRRNRKYSHGHDTTV